jgi:hypothetical protein
VRTIGERPRETRLAGLLAEALAELAEGVPDLAGD